MIPGARLQEKDGPIFQSAFEFSMTLELHKSPAPLQQCLAITSHFVTAASNMASDYKRNKETISDCKSSMKLASCHNGGVVTYHIVAAKRATTVKFSLKESISLLCGRVMEPAPRPQFLTINTCKMRDNGCAQSVFLPLSSCTV